MSALTGILIAISRFAVRVAKHQEKFHRNIHKKNYLQPGPLTAPQHKGLPSLHKNITFYQRVYTRSSIAGTLDSAFLWDVLHLAVISSLWSSLTTLPAHTRLISFSHNMALYVQL